MTTMTDNTTNYDFDTLTLNSPTYINSQINNRYNIEFFSRAFVANWLSSTLKFPRIESCESIISDTNKDVLRNKQAKLKVISRIKELEKYQEGWYDGFDGIQAYPQAIKDAQIFAKNLDFNHIHCPYISLARDGEVNFWWDLETIKLDLGFYGDGTYSYYAKLKNGKEFFGDDEDSNSTIPLEILERLKK